MSMEFYMLESTVRGHHVYKVTWTPMVEQVLHVQSEIDKLCESYLCDSSFTCIFT